MPEIQHLQHRRVDGVKFLSHPFSRTDKIFAPRFWQQLQPESEKQEKRQDFLSSGQINDS